MTKIALYAAPGSCARVTMVALEHIGLPFEYRLVRMMAQQQHSLEYLAVNPKGRVPSLVIDGEVLTENVAILLYLSRRFPASRLLPSKTDDLTAMRQVADLCFCSATLHPIVTRIRNPHFFVHTEGAKKQVHQCAIEAMKPNFELIRERLHYGSWWYGEQWSVMDAYLYWVWFRATDAGFPGDNYPEIAGFAQRMESRESTQRMLHRELDAEQKLRKEGLIE